MSVAHITSDTYWSTYHLIQQLLLPELWAIVGRYMSIERYHDVQTVKLLDPYGRILTKCFDDQVIRCIDQPLDVPLYCEILSLNGIELWCYDLGLIYPLTYIADNTYQYLADKHRIYDYIDKLRNIVIYDAKSITNDVSRRIIIKSRLHECLRNSQFLIHPIKFGTNAVFGVGNS